MNKFVAMALISATVSAHAADFYDTGKISQVTPNYETVNVPVQSCTTETQIIQERSNTGAILGGIAGAIIGSQVGGGKGKIVTGAVGAGVGAIAGDRIDNSDNQPQARQVQRCGMVTNYQQVIRGYNVTYQYNGKYYQTVMGNQPQIGDSIRLRVTVNPN